MGLLIEKASGKKYEDYIQKYVLDAAGLSSTYMFKSKANEPQLASGYKLGFLLPQYYNAPWYEGNKPAGYIISSANDMATWLKLQMDTDKSSLLDAKLIAQSQYPNLSVNTFGEGMAYAAGWIVYNNAGTEILHSGSNPNFSSFIIFRPDEKTGVAVLCNTNTTYAMDIAQSIIKISVILIIFVLISCIVYSLPGFLFNGATWSYMIVWYPVTVKVALFSIYTSLFLLLCNILIKILL